MPRRDVCGILEASGIVMDGGYVEMRLGIDSGVSAPRESIGHAFGYLDGCCQGCSLRKEVGAHSAYITVQAGG